VLRKGSQQVRQDRFDGQGHGRCMTRLHRARQRGKVGR